jgi:hypothetical protein
MGAGRILAARTSRYIRDDAAEGPTWTFMFQPELAHSDLAKK